MGIWAIVPVRALHKGKSRLSEILSDDERTMMNITMLGNTLGILKSIPKIEQVLVVSPDSNVLSLAREYGAKTVQEDGQTNPQIALSKAKMIAKMYSATGLLVLSADIPLLTKQDISLIMDLADNPPIAVIAPDWQGQGTNAICINPFHIMNFQVGPNSFQVNVAEAEARGIRVATCQLTNLGLDIDNPADVELLKQTQAFGLGSTN